MLKENAVLSEVIYQKVVRNLANQKWFLAKTKEANERFNMPLDIASDYLNGNKKVEDKDWFTGFVLASVVDKALVPEYFTPMEISQYKDQKYKSRVVDKIDIPMIQVCSDQFIGTVTFQWLMNVEDSHLICYNENTQRVPRARTKPGGGVIYDPYVNQRSVKEIAEAFKRGDYVPNTITFNIREDIDFQYEDGHIIIEKFPKGQPIFDIIDGYHRYRAMRQVYITDPKFDYGMELRIVRFSVEKARQFIYQESLRNKMKKVDQAAFNQNSLENQVVDELNEFPPFRNMFSGVDAKIDKAVMAMAIRNVYFRTAEERTRAKKIETKKNLVQKGRLLEEEMPELFEKKWTNEDIIGFVVASDLGGGDHLVSTMMRLTKYAHELGKLKRKSVLESDIKFIIKKEGGAQDV